MDKTKVLRGKDSLILLLLSGFLSNLSHTTTNSISKIVPIKFLKVRTKKYNFNLQHKILSLMPWPILRHNHTLSELKHLSTRVTHPIVAERNGIKEEESSSSSSTTQSSSGGCCFGYISKSKSSSKCEKCPLKTVLCYGVVAAGAFFLGKYLAQNK